MSRIKRFTAVMTMAAAIGGLGLTGVASASTAHPAMVAKSSHSQTVHPGGYWWYGYGYGYYRGWHWNGYWWYGYGWGWYTGWHWRSSLSIPSG